VWYDRIKQRYTQSNDRGVVKELARTHRTLELREWSSYGYELMEKMATFGLNTMNAGTFYRTLRQMEKDGIVQSSWETSEGGPARRMYSITEAGEAYLKLWAESLDQYQRMMNTFFQLYTGRPRKEQTESESKTEKEDQQ